MFKSKISLGVFALGLAMGVLSTPAFAARSGVINVSATVNSTLAVTFNDATRQAFDPAFANEGVRLGVVSVTGNVANFQITIYRAQANGTLLQADTSQMLLRHATSPDTIPYSVTLQPVGSAVALNSTNYVTNYGATFRNNVTETNARGIVGDYNLLSKNDAPGAAVASGRYQDFLILDLVSL